MPRPPCCRRVSADPPCSLFRPAGVVARSAPVVMTLDELEAMRLADLEGLYQEQAASQMGVSRSTFGRIVTSARRKVAEALVGGKALRVEGGSVERRPHETRCEKCKLAWDPAGCGETKCPSCRCPVRTSSRSTSRVTRSRGEDGMVRREDDKEKEV